MISINLDVEPGESALLSVGERYYEIRCIDREMAAEASGRRLPNQSLALPYGIRDLRSGTSTHAGVRIEQLEDGNWAALDDAGGLSFGAHRAAWWKRNCALGLLLCLNRSARGGLGAILLVGCAIAEHYDLMQTEQSMNARIVENLLNQALTNRLPEFPDDDDRKLCEVRAEFSLEGKTYLPTDALELSASKAKQLWEEGKVTILRGGLFTKLRIGKYMMPGFRPWDSPHGADKTDFDQMMLPVRVLKPQRQIIVGLSIHERPLKFYFPWCWIRSLSFCLEDELASNAVFEILLEPPTG
jgi:hypothetical protein